MQHPRVSQQRFQTGIAKLSSVVPVVSQPSEHAVRRCLQVVHVVQAVARHAAGCPALYRTPMQHPRVTQQRVETSLAQTSHHNSRSSYSKKTTKTIFFEDQSSPGDDRDQCFQSDAMAIPGLLADDGKR